MKYQVQENCLTIFLPGELDHHNAEEIRKESDHLIEHNHIRYVIFDFADTKFCDSSGILQRGFAREFRHHAVKFFEQRMEQLAIRPHKFF